VQNCRGCDAPIIWVETPNGKRRPLDAEPSQERGTGTYAIRGKGPNVTGVPVKDADADEPVHMNHWTTCPARDQFRKKG
jgi:hypothetical protein